MKKYVKAVVIAKNSPQGSYAAGCPEKQYGPDYDSIGCKACERTR